MNRKGSLQYYFCNNNKTIHHFFCNHKKTINQLNMFLSVLKEVKGVCTPVHSTTGHTPLYGTVGCGTTGQQSYELMSCLLISRLLLQGVEPIFQIPTSLAPLQDCSTRTKSEKINQPQIRGGFPAPVASCEYGLVRLWMIMFPH